MARGRGRIVAGIVIVLALASAGLRLERDDRGPVVRAITLDQQPVGALVDERSGRLFVLTAPGSTGAFSNSVSPYGKGRVQVFDMAGGTRVWVEETGHPCAIVAAPAGQNGRVFVAAGSPGVVGGAMLMFDAASGRLLHETPTPATLCGGAPVVDRGRGRVFFAGDDGSLNTFDAGAGLLLYSAQTDADGAAAMAVDERNGHVFVAPANKGVVEVFAASSGLLLHTIVFGGAQPLLTPIVDPGSGRLLVVDLAASALSALDARGYVRLNVASVVPAPEAWALDSSPADAHSGGRLLVGGDTALSVVDTRTVAVVRTLTLGDHTRRILVDGRTRRAFLLTGDHLGPTGRIPVVDTRTGRLVTMVNLPGVAADAALDARRDRLVVAGQDGTVTVLDARTGRLLYAVDAASANPVALALDAGGGHAYVLHGSGTVSVPDRWPWLPAWLRARLPFLPRGGASYQNVPAGITVVDDTR